MRRSIWLLAVMIVATLPAPADAAFPGQNGRIAFTSSQDGDSEVYSINPDGTGQLKLTDNTIADFSPSWSPDGEQLVFLRADGDDFDIWKMNADGTGQVLVLDYPGASGFGPNAPAWSPDGARIVFGVTDSDNRGLCQADFEDDICGLFTVNPDGGNLQTLVQTLSDACCPSWSSDGSRVVFASGEVGLEGVWNIVVKTIGGGSVTIATGPQLEDSSFDPDWRPGMQKILFTFNPETGGSDLYQMNPDGSAKQQVRVGAREPVWSPDGTKIAFMSIGSPAGVYIANANGSGATFLVDGSVPSWQPVPIASYPRPKGATPVRSSLVPAYAPCMSPNPQHGPPLAFPSCNPPAQMSPHLTVGSPDVTGTAANFVGHLLTRVLVGNPVTPADEADVAIEVSTTDMRCSATSPPSTCGASNTAGGPDYTGELEGVAFLTITDKDNTPHPGGPGAATVQEFDLRFSVPCADPFPSPSIGSSCSVSTTVDALVPGAVKEGKRAIWQLDRVHVRDGGPDGDAATAGNRVFLRPGVFNP